MEVLLKIALREYVVVFFPPQLTKCANSVTFPSPPQEIQSKVVLLYDDD